MYSYRDEEKIEVGVEVYLFYPGGMGKRGRYEGPLKITKTTKTQFTAGGERFIKSNGRKVGSPYGRFSPSVQIATAEVKREVTEFRAETMRLKDAARLEADSAERQSREKYGATAITNEAIQDACLKPLRSLAECGEKEMSSLLDAFKDVSIENDNFWRVEDAIERENRNNSFAYGKVIRDQAITLHQSLVDLILEFEAGTRYEVDGVEIKTAEELVNKKLRRVLSEQYRRFFGYTFSNSDISTADQRFITTLREILGDSEYDGQLKRIKTEEVA